MLFVTVFVTNACIIISHIEYLDQSQTYIINYHTLIIN